MLTFKQVEALYWIDKLGGFAAAANKLNTTQSAISKRIHELERVFEIDIFDRSRRNAKLTEKGYELLTLSKELLDKRDSILESISTKEVLCRRICIGATELTALTWLPMLIEEIRKYYPKVTILPQIELTSVLFERLMDDSLDLIIAPDVMEDARYLTSPLKPVKNAWMCSPDYTDTEEVISIEELGKFNVLAQEGTSGTGLVYQRWLKQHKVKISNYLISSNLIAQLGFVLSGQGITYLPVNAMQSLIDAGKLKIIHVTPGLPNVRYAVLHRADRTTQIYRDIVDYSAKCCNYNSLII